MSTSVIFDIFKIIALIAVIYLLARPMIRGAVYFPTRSEKVKHIISLARLQGAKNIVDLGSGDGRILIAFAKEGIEAHGYEVDPIFVCISKWAIRRAGLQHRAFVHWQSFWGADLSRFDTVVVYGIPYIMKRLKTKLQRELQSGSRIISNIFAFPGWQPVSQEGGLYLYIKS